MSVKRIPTAALASAALPDHSKVVGRSRISRKFRSAVGATVAVIMSTALGAFGGYSMGTNDVAVEAVIHSWAQTDSQLYFAGPLGEFTEESSIVGPVDIGANRVRFPVRTRVVPGS